MKILFIDPVEWAYDTTTPLKQPLGGTQSAVAYLSGALARMGHDVAVINGVSSGLEPIESEGVRFMRLPCSTPAMNEFDVLVLASKAMAEMVRDAGCTRPLVMWSQHAADQPAVQALRNPAERGLYAGFALVSQWQADSFQETFGIDPAATKIMRNGVSPGFLTSTPAMRWLKTGSAPVLGYSSTPYRGLDILLLSFAAIRAKIEGATLRVFSSMGIYFGSERAENGFSSLAQMNDGFSSLYELARVLPGVTYVGPLPQPRLAEAMADIDIWAYPCTFPETSCISAMEAMASGNLMISTALGALPETTAGFARLTEIGGNLIRVPGKASTSYADQFLQIVKEVSATSQQSLQSIARQIQFARTHYNWTTRATEWSVWLEQIAGQSGQIAARRSA